MTMNSSGPISLGGATAGQSINLENGFSATAQVSLNDTAVRNLAGVASGAITMPTNFYGKSNRAAISYTFSANTANASLNVTSISGYIAGKSDITVTISSGIYLYSTSTGTPGLTLSGGASGDTVTLVNNGFIMGKGGDGGNGAVAGNAGGPALSLGFATTINNTNAAAYIGGGGGSGGNMNTRPMMTSGGGAGGGNSGYNSSLGMNSPRQGGSVGSAGANGADYDSSAAYGGAGGRILPGTGGASRTGNYNLYPMWGYGGGSGGGGACGGLYDPEGGSATMNGGGGGGGWGASGGSSVYGYQVSYMTGGAGGSANASGGTPSPAPAGILYAGGAGGKAVALNGYSVTWTSSDTARVYGSIS